MSEFTIPDAASPRLEVPALHELPRARLRAMLAAGEEVQECARALRRGGLNPVGEVLRGQGTFYEYEHYPEGDVYDPDSRAQYYYHAHRGLEGEHGHFHTFLRRGGMPADVRPLPHRGTEPRPSGAEEISHLVAVSMEHAGWPIGLFATNRWVTGETWYAAQDVVRMLDRFHIDHAWPSWPVNRWLGAMFGLFRPQMEALLHHRDRVLHAHRARHPERDVYEDRELEITGALRIDVEAQIAALRGALAGRGAG